MAAETRLKVIYSVTSTTNSTQLFKTSYFSQAELEDGTVLPSNIFDVGNHAYVFSATGNNVVFYTMTGSTLGDEAFEGMTRIVAVDIPSTVTTLGERCFRNCTNLSSVTLADTVSSFGEGAFDADVALESIVIPSTAVTMNSKVFRGCTSLTSITMSDTTAPAVSADTFYQVQTGGTLYYPSGSTYSNWLSNNEYYLGYYGWNGVETGGTPTGQTVITGFSSTYTYNFNGVINNDLLLTAYIPFFPADADYDFEVTSTNSNVAVPVDIYMSGVLSKSAISVSNGVAEVNLRFYSGNTGTTSITLRDKNSNLYTRRSIYHNPSNTTPNIYMNPSAVTLAADFSVDTGGGIVSNMPKISETQATDVYILSGFPYNGQYTFDSDSPDDWSPSIYGRYSGGTYPLLLGDTDENSGNTRQSLYKGTAVDAYYNTYYVEFLLTQEGSGTPIQKDIHFKKDTENLVAQRTSKEVQIEVCGCTIDTERCDLVSYTGDIQILGVSALSEYYAKIAYPVYSGATNLTGSVTVRFYDTSGNTYTDTLNLTQNAAAWLEAIPTIPYELTPYGPAYASAYSVDVHITSGSQRVVYDIKTVNCTFTGVTEMSKSWSSSNPDFPGLDDPLPELHVDVQGKQIYYDMPQNTYEDMRGLLAILRLHATSTLGGYGDFYNQERTRIIQSAATQDRWVYLQPSGRTHNAYTDASSNFSIRGSGCSIDNAYTPTFTFSGDTTWIDSIERVTYSRLQSAWTVYYKVSRNLGQSDREIYITANGVHDTDGNVYNDLVFHATQNYGSYVFLNYDKGNGYVSSARTTQTAEVVGVNTNICSVEIYSAWSQTPQYWEDVEQPTVSLLGNYLTVVWPENPYSNNRHYIVQLMVYRGENCSNGTVLDYSMSQYRAETPVQKDIKADDADYSVGSGTGNASTTVQVSGCTYDHFTYITGGSFSVTATSGPNNTIVFTYPENPTNSTRTGYVYITFYDSDGNTYGPQTITFTQQAGSSPGPGPGPDPSTGYVLTTLTISDQEQHRYFVEARPGVVYSAAGQYYKTILACEARYSLYYVNSYGGVDVLPFKEKGWKKSDTITRFNYSRSFRNNTPEFENVNYMNEIKASWELHTGWLSDEQSKRMHELIESTIVYLYDAEEKTYTPVVMTDKKLEYKTYHNQGKKFYNYTVNVEESQSKERR